MDLTKLAEPFPEADIEWRMDQCGKGSGGLWGMALAYVTARAIMSRLDEVCEPQNWRNEFREWRDHATLCGISICIEGEWVTKWDGADETQIEATKGGFSKAMVRAAVQWGIGRYLYGLDSGFLPRENISETKRGDNWRGAKLKGGTRFFWLPPKLPMWALPAGTPPAQGSGKTPLKTWLERIATATSIDHCRNIWKDAKADGLPPQDLAQIVDASEEWEKNHPVIDVGF